MNESNQLIWLEASNQLTLAVWLEASYQSVARLTPGPLVGSREQWVGYWTRQGLLAPPCCRCGYQGRHETPCLGGTGAHCSHWWDGPENLENASRGIVQMTQEAQRLWARGF